MGSQLEGGNTCIKYLVFIFNFLFFLVGCGLLGIGIYSKVGDNDYIDVAEDLSSISEYITLGNILIAVGVIILIVAFFGCCGAIMENQTMLTIFFSLLLLIFILELAGGIYGFVNRDEIENQLEKDFNDAIQKKYFDSGDNSFVKKTIDKFQTDFKCCGFNGFEDWQQSTYYANKSTIPKSCCKDQSDQSPCPASRDPKDFNQKGCFVEVMDFFKENAYAAAACGIAFAVLQVLGLVFSMCLICALKRTGTTA